MANTNHTETATSGVGGNSTLCFVFDEPSIKALRVFAYCIVILVSLIGNSLLLVVVRRENKRKGTMNYLIANIAIADLVITVVYMPRMITVAIQGYEWLVGGTTGLVLCKLVAFAHYVALLVSIQTLVVLSLERFLVVVYPFRIPFTVRRAKLIISVIWLSAITVRLPLFVGLQTESNSRGQLRCRDRLNKITGNSESREIYDHILSIAFYAFPVVIITVLYSAAAIKLKRTGHSRDGAGHNRKEHQRRATQNNGQVFVMLVVITLAFVLCWLAYFVARKGVIGVGSLPCNVLFIRNFLAHLNCAVTPCIYAIFSERYKAACKKLFIRFSRNFSPGNLFLKRRILALDEGRRANWNLSRESIETVVFQNFNTLALV